MKSLAPAGEGAQNCLPSAVNKRLQQFIALIAANHCLWAADGLALRIEPHEIIVKSGSFLNVAATLQNNSMTNITLVMPGDGSDYAWRTPVVGWSLIPVDAKEEHPWSPPRPQGARCGNVSAMREDEIFELKPSEKRTMTNSVGKFVSSPPGLYKALFYYWNQPDIKPHGIALGPVTEETKKAIKASAPCRLISNEIVVIVTP